MLRGLFMLFILPAFLLAQNICGFFNESVIVRDAENIGAVGNSKWVVRETHAGIIPVGKIKIEERFEDMVIADVTFEKSGYQIAVGDIVTEEDEIIPILMEEKRSQYTNAKSVDPYARDHHVLQEKSYPFRRLRIGFSVGTLLPYQTFHQRTNYSYQVGPVLQYGFNSRSVLVFDCMYSFMDERSQPTNMPKLNNQSVMNVNALFRHGLYHSIFIDLGAGVYIPRVSVTATADQRKVNSLEYHYGVCAGFAINCIQSNSLSMFINPRYHTYFMQNEMIENVSVGMNFIL